MLQAVPEDSIEVGGCGEAGLGGSHSSEVVITGQHSKEVMVTGLPQNDEEEIELSDFLTTQ